MEFLDCARGPLDSHGVRSDSVAQPEMRQQTRLSKTGSSGNLPQLPHVRCSDCRMQAHFGADARPVRGRADTFHLQPVIRVAVVPVEEIRPAALPVRDEKVKEAVVVIVCPGAAGGVAAIVDQAAGCDFGECAVAVVVVESVVLPAIVCRKQIEETIVVVVDPLHDLRILRVEHH